ncbi:MAG: ribonuclease H-like YkuK family protein, partial [Ignavibacteria bacterium]|nr:ribonuclease H-like YkuK family protein [Ignavibacteria bacterium]
MLSTEDKEISNGNFFSPTRGDLSFEQVIVEIFSYMQESPENAYEVVVGCDSPSSDKPFFPIAIVVLKTGFGGRFFLKKMHYDDNFLKRFVNWKNRILQEVYLSCELALQLREVLENKTKELNYNFNYQFEYIHADVGERGKTKEMIKEVVGLIKSNGFEAKIKPQS